MESTPTLPRRSSSSSTAGVTRLFSSNNRASKLRAERVSSTGSEASYLSQVRNPHRSLERSGGGKARVAYTGSHSTSSLPRRGKEEEGVVRRRSKEEEGVRKRSKEEELVRKRSKDVDEPPGGPLFTFLASGPPATERRRGSLVKGESTESLDRREEQRVRRQSPSPLPRQKVAVSKSVTKDIGKPKEGKKVATTPTKKPEVRRVARPSTTAPVRAATLPRSSRLAGGSSTAPIIAAAASSSTAPIIRRPLALAASSPTPRRKEAPAAVIATDARNKTTIKITKSLPATKKVSFEYSGRAGEVQVQPGLALTDYHPAPPPRKGLLGSVRVSDRHGGSDLSLNRRGRGGEEVRGSTPTLVRKGGGGGGGAEELAETWLRLKEDIEEAMGRKPETRTGQYKELSAMLQVRRGGNLTWDHPVPWTMELI